MRVARAARASVMAGAVLVGALGLAAPSAQASSGCSDTSKPFYVCVDSNTYFRYLGYSSYSLSLHSSRPSTDYRITTNTGFNQLEYPGWSQSFTGSGGSIQVCGSEATYGKYCVTVSPTVSNAT
ncbi:hypothetical protein CFP65_6374 [Kitasatospora sp. MMS16-BH015]|uniref:hypothetical protein n=1 Tax=Kitasatospora sp. MMS16-BH015 TaxID=2018025 RepID=UPI000CA29063|nr:hypothetical protein [Kitasatospora sp. MMS16-BH015]AUG81030.1 hypothetical protein CFP65_6374 [Kitasatospora sp. MMS16-BH015]